MSSNGVRSDVFQVERMRRDAAVARERRAHGTAVAAMEAAAARVEAASDALRAAREESDAEWSSGTAAAGMRLHRAGLRERVADAERSLEKAREAYVATRREVRSTAAALDEAVRRQGAVDAAVERRAESAGLLRRRKADEGEP